MGQHIFHTQKGTITAVLGTCSAALTLTDGIMKHLLITPSNLTAVYDVKLIDINGFEVYEEIDVTGKISDTSELPIYGNMTLLIENSDQDIDFQYLLVSKER